MPHDPESGLVYDEREIRTKSLPADWVWRFRGPGSNQRTQGFRNDNGAASLLEMTVRCVGFQIRDLEPGSLEGMPWRLARLAWE